MNLKTIAYADYEQQVPQQGKHILAQQKEENLIVYQAFNPNIARYALEHQCFGGSAYSYNRMSWIKPNFLWMMYRSAWASKEGQEYILAIEISKLNFEKILSEAVPSNYDNKLYPSKEGWKADLASSNVRLQWDPDHHPNGGKLERRAIQLGLRREMLKAFGQDWILSIQDVTPWVKEQAKKLPNQVKTLEVMQESVIEIQDPKIKSRLGMM